MTNKEPDSESIEIPDWSSVEEAGGRRGWVLAELQRRDLIDEREPSSLKPAELKRFKAQRDEERRVGKLLRSAAWQSYRQAHLVHLGQVFHHDVPDIDRFDVADREERLADNLLPPLENAQELAQALGITISRLRWLAYHREVDSGTHYHRWTVPKKSGGERLISAPKPELKAAQTWIWQNIAERLPIHGCAHGFVPGRSTVTCANAHAGAKVVVKFDLSDFYPTVTMPRVKGLLRKAGYIEQVATVLALLCTEPPRDEMQIDGKTYFVATGPRALPQGAPTSPALSNAVFLRADLRLAGLAKKLGCIYTRYADDLTFSFDVADAPVGKLMGGVQAIVESSGFRLHPKKTRIMRGGRRQKITGLVVNTAPDGAPLSRVPRRTVRALRTAIHKRRHGHETKETLAQLQGMIAYVHMADPKKGKELLAALREATSNENTPSSGDES